MKVLHGHTSPETAYVVDDYPYGFRLRCKIRYWIEWKKGTGMRFVSQTTNPKIPGREVWNKPKASTYSNFMCMYLDENDHVQHWSVSIHSPMSYFKFYATGMYHQLPEEEQKKLDVMYRYMRVSCASTMAERDEVAGALSRLVPLHPGLSANEMRAVVEEDMKRRYYESDFAVYYDCFLYDASRSCHAKTANAGS